MRASTGNGAIEAIAKESEAQNPGRRNGYKYRRSPATSSSVFLTISTAAFQPSSLPAFQHFHSSTKLQDPSGLFRPLQLPPVNMRSTAFLLPALVAASPVAQIVGNDGWADAPDPAQIQIVDASFSGSGCPQGTVSTSISPDKTVCPLTDPRQHAQDADPQHRSSPLALMPSRPRLDPAPGSLTAPRTASFT